MKNNQYSKYNPEEIFEIFKEQHRLTSPLDPVADESFALTKETVIADLQDAQDLLPWQEWTEWLNQCYGIEAKKSEWKEVLIPTTKKTLWDVCVFISKRAKKEEIKPIQMLGKECLSAAVFLTLKKNMKNKGAKVENVKPSTNISAFLEDNLNFSPLLEEVTLTGVKTFEKLTLGTLEPKGSFKYWVDKIIPNIIFKRPINTHDLVTFRDLVNRIIENNKLTHTP